MKITLLFYLVLIIGFQPFVGCSTSHDPLEGRHSSTMTIQELDDKKIAKILRETNYSRRDFVNYLNISDLIPRDVEGSADGFPVYRYAVGKRYLFVKVELAKDRVVEAFLSD